MLAAVVTILLVCTLAGVLLFIWGLRGRAINDHPVCRGCGFDLFNKPADSTRCPECGADITCPVAIRTGARQRRTAPVAVGALLAILGLTTLAVLQFGTQRGVNWDHYKPVWWLLRQADTAAILELRLRHERDLLTDAQTRTVVAAALDIQADRARPWDPVWGRLLTEARGAGHLTPDQWQRYVTQAVHLDLVARPRVARNNTLPAEVIATCRAWSGFSPLYLSVRTLSLTFDDIRLQGESKEFDGGCMVDDRSSRCDSYFPRLTDRRLANTANGPHTVKLELEWRVREWDARTRNISTAVAATGRVTLTQAVNLVRKNSDIVTLVTDESLRAAVERSVTLGPDTPTPTWLAAIVIPSDSYARPKLYLEIKKPPVGLAFTVILRDPAGREFPSRERWVWGAGYAASPHRDDTPLLAGSLDGFDADHADVILRPSPERALKTPDLTAIWGNDITLKNVPVVWEKGAARPTKLPG